MSYLCDSKSTPFLLPEQLQGTGGCVVVILWDCLEHSLGDLDVAILEVVIGIPWDRLAIGLSWSRQGALPSRVVYRVDELLQALSLWVSERSGILIATTVVGVRHSGGWFAIAAHLASRVVRERRGSYSGHTNDRRGCFVLRDGFVCRCRINLIKKDRYWACFMMVNGESEMRAPWIVVIQKLFR